MLHIATVHWMTDKWIDVQGRYLARNVGQPYRVYASLTGVTAGMYSRFHFASDRISAPDNPLPRYDHAHRLNVLAAHIADEADDDDVLVFLDGDAFPIADLATPVSTLLDRYPLLAVRRDENLMDAQPHPSFCATTVGYWKRLEGDWSPGYRWRNAAGEEVSDVGGNLLGALRRRGDEWYPLRRTNTRNPHPLWFGVYDDLVYHHGAGFRSGSGAGRVTRGVKALRFRLSAGRYERMKGEVFDRLCTNDDFWRELFVT